MHLCAHLHLSQQLTMHRRQVDANRGVERVACKVGTLSKQTQ